MAMESLAKLEERIGKAVAHIEKLVERTKTLEAKNDEMMATNARLTEEIKQLNDEMAKTEARLSAKDDTIADLERKYQDISEKVKDKVERLLKRIDGFEQAAQ